MESGQAALHRLPVQAPARSRACLSRFPRCRVAEQPYDLYVGALVLLIVVCQGLASVTSERNVQKRPLADFLQTPEKRARGEQADSRQPPTSLASVGETQAAMNQDAIVCVLMFSFCIRPTVRRFALHQNRFGIFAWNWK